MIVPKREAKCYGAVHIDNYLTFTGFCKKVDSDEICDVDVFVDGKKIDTLTADKKIGKIEEIYDIEGHGFEFDLSDEYFEKSHLLEFKASSGEELVNSKIKTIDKQHPSFKEYSFWHLLDKYVPQNLENYNNYDKVGFLAIDDTFQDKKFIDFVKLLKEKFVEIKFVAFYFNDTQKQKAIEIFGNDTLYVIPKNIDDISSNCSVYLHSQLHRENPILAYYNVRNILKSKSNNTFVLELNKSVDTIENLFENVSLTVSKKLDLLKSFVIELIPEDRLNEYEFLNSLGRVNPEEIKDMYCPNSIGFLATEAKLNDKEFLGYIAELMTIFPNTTFKGFCFYEDEVQKLNNLISGQNFSSILVKNFKEMYVNIEILIIVPVDIVEYFDLFNFTIKYLKNILVINYHQSAKGTFLRDYAKEFQHVYFTDKKFEFSKESIKSANGDVNQLMYNELYKIALEEQVVNKNTDYYNLHYFERIRLALKSKNVKSRLIKLYTWKAM